MAYTIRPRDLIALRRGDRRRPFAASELPADVPTAYDVAAATLGLMAKPVAAWKLGATTAGTRKTFSTDVIYYGGLVGDEVWCCTDGGSVPMPAILRGEAEIAFRLAVDLELGDVLPGSDVLFDAWAPVIEAPYSCVENIPEAGLCALLMDRCAAGGLYMGAPRANIDDTAVGGLLEIMVEDKAVASGAAGTSLLMSPLEAALGFLAVAADQGVAVRAGQWISTGGITPCVGLPFGQSISLRLAGDTVFSVTVPVPPARSAP